MRQVLYRWNARLFDLIQRIHTSGWHASVHLISCIGNRRDFALYAAAICLVGMIVIARALARNRGEAIAFRWFMVVSVFAIGSVLSHMAVTLMRGWSTALHPHIRVLIGFPSDHAAFSGLLAASLWPVAPTAGRALLLLLTTGVCLVRISTAGQRPTDVVTGLVAGLLVATVLQRLLAALWRSTLPVRHEVS